MNAIKEDFHGNMYRFSSGVSTTTDTCSNQRSGTKLDFAQPKGRKIWGAIHACKAQGQTLHSFTKSFMEVHDDLLQFRQAKEVEHT
jgi:hypothetical protein